MRTFAYCRVSTDDQTPANQAHEIAAAGFTIEPRRIITEHISGSVAADKRPQFANLIERMEDGDVLIVTKLDRLGRNAMDVRSTIELLASNGVRVHCLQLGGADLTSSTGKLMLSMITAFAEFERDLIIERTHAGLARAKAAGVKMGRKPSLSEAERTSVIKRIEAGDSIAAIARDFQTTRATVQRIRAAKTAQS